MYLAIFETRVPQSRSKTLTPPLTPATATRLWPTPSQVSTPEEKAVSPGLIINLIKNNLKRNSNTYILLQTFGWLSLEFIVWNMKGKLGCNDIGTRNSAIVAKTQFP